MKHAGLVDTENMNALIAFEPQKRAALRALISHGLAPSSARQPSWEAALVDQSAATLHVPRHIGDHTDSYTSVHHDTTVGKQFRPDNPLLPNYKWVPIGYHGRASSIIPSEQAFKRPYGQTRSPDATAPSCSRRGDWTTNSSSAGSSGRAMH